MNPAARWSIVAPLGCERLVGLLLARYPGRVTCFLSTPFHARDWKSALRKDLERARPQLVCLSFRNLDECVFLGRRWHGPTGPRTGCRFFVPALVEVINLVRGLTTAPLVLGGTGFLCAPLPLLRATGLRFGVVGPGEAALLAVVGRMVEGAAPDEALAAIAGRLGLVDAAQGELPASPAAIEFGPPVTPRHPLTFRLALEAGERVPVLFSYGCNRPCRYCVEPSLLHGRVLVRPLDDVLEELRVLARLGVQKVWLACSEANVPDAKAATHLFRAMAAQHLSFDVRSFFCTARISEDLLEALEEAGQRPWEQSVEMGHLSPPVLRGGFGPSGPRAIERLADLYLRRGYPTMGGTMLVGGPLETWETLEDLVRRARALDRAFPEGFGLTVGVGLRVYPASRLGREVLPELDVHRRWLYPRRRSDVAGLRPTFYCKPDTPWNVAAFLAQGLADLRGGFDLLTSL